MSTSKVLFCSINSIGEYGGGGIYCRTIYYELLHRYGPGVDVICKAGPSDNIPSQLPMHRITTFEKNLVVDLVSRLVLIPCFLGVYYMKILLLIKREHYSVVVFHSSRLGVLAALVKCFFSSRVEVYFDNAEALLAKKNRNIHSLKGCLNAVDSLLLTITERLAATKVDAVSFITKRDQVFFSKRFSCVKSSVLPVKIIAPAKTVVAGRRRPDTTGLVKILFTADFNFPPNLDALDCVLECAIKEPGLEFWLAGKHLRPAICGRMIGGNVNIVDSPSRGKMAEIFAQSHIYFSPVRFGSGMKTKLAEAFAFGLPVVASDHSVIGYESVSGRQFIEITSEISGQRIALKRYAALVRGSFDAYIDISEQARNAFDEYYRCR